MTTNNEHIEPSIRERELQRTARMVTSLLEQTGRPVPETVVVEVLRQRQARGTPLGQLTFSSQTLQELADWWEEHQKAGTDFSSQQSPSGK